MYKIGDEIRCKYQNPPVKEQDRYKPGSFVQIWDQESKLRLAAYLVIASDDTYIDGIISWVAEPAQA